MAAFMARPGWIGASLLLLMVLLSPAAFAADPPRPNVLILFADDLGWGDVGSFNPGSKIPTPHMDKLAGQGMRFTDAHSSSGVCVPSRFSLMTGLHAFRMAGKGHPEPKYRQYGGNQSTVPLIPDAVATLPGLFKKAGYATGMVGKWHLGFDDLLRRPTEPLRGGPVDRGFDTYFGIPSSLDIGPYLFIENDRIVKQATEEMPAHGTPGWPRPFMGEFWRADLAAPGFRHADALPTMTGRAEERLAELASNANRQPFLFYYAMPAPHSPLLPSKEFQGRTKLGMYGMYGDYVAQTDADIGRLLKVLDDKGVADNTLVIVTSDNGPLWYPENVEATGHAASGPYRGMKGDAWEGGHRVPLIARWPDHVPVGAKSDALVSLTDLLATLTAVANVPTADTDGVDFSAALLGQKWNRPESSPVVARSSAGANVLRVGQWKFIDRLGSGGFSDPRTETPEAGGPSVQLYDLSKDPSEQRNLAGTDQDRVDSLRKLAESVRASRPVAADPAGR